MWRGLAVSAVVALCVSCSEDMVTVTVIPHHNNYSTLYEDTKVYADGDLVDVIVQGDTATISVEDGADLVAKFVKTSMEPSIRVTNEEDTETASDGLVWKID